MNDACLLDEKHPRAPLLIIQREKNMHENEVRQILRRYCSGQASRLERKLIDAWYTAIDQSAEGFEPDPESGKRYWANILSHINTEDAGKDEKRKREI